jgi:predicted MFS family arabinose efflux permease
VLPKQNPASTYNSPTSPNVPPAFTGYQKFVVGILAFLQFTIILDFMILSPLGAMLMPALKLTTSQFGWVVSVYAFSAGASGLLAAGFADRFDRKKMLLFFYSGFVLGTLFCGLAPSYEMLVLARMVTGIFGGVIGSIVFAITTDLFPMEMRGRVMGAVQTSFAASQVMGLPIGLYFANHWGWNAPFLLIVGVSTVVGVFMAIYLRPIDGHLKLQSTRNPFMHLANTVRKPRYIGGYCATALLATGGFMIMPFSSAFTVNNLGIRLDNLPMIYMITGMCSIITGPMMGRVADSIGKFKVFCFGSCLSIVMILIYTSRGATPLGGVVLISAGMFIAITARMVAASALVSAVPLAADRGAFMSVNSSIQQISGGAATALAGLIVVQQASGHIEHFDTLGYVVVFATLITIAMMYRIHRTVYSD